MLFACESGLWRPVLHAGCCTRGRNARTRRAGMRRADEGCRPPAGSCRMALHQQAPCSPHDNTMNIQGPQAFCDSRQATQLIHLSKLGRGFTSALARHAASCRPPVTHVALCTSWSMSWLKPHRLDMLARMPQQQICQLPAQSCMASPLPPSTSPPGRSRVPSSVCGRQWTRALQQGVPSSVCGRRWTRALRQGVPSCMEGAA